MIWLETKIWHYWLSASAFVGFCNTASAVLLYRMSDSPTVFDEQGVPSNS